MPGWPSAPPPPAGDGLRWELSDVAELPGMREELRRSEVVDGLADLRDRLVLVLDEMASNALRHGGGHVEAAVRRTGDALLVAVSDGAAATPPTPAVDRDPSEGGLGLYLIAELSSAHGWYVDGDGKTVWAVLPTR
ncbi:ATP-binding protein [Geodermatophilus aquaeductus]|uniref:Histidine kinase-like ATPase domain-containing protein n=1 Tax=Geodermatophilus aquaeductus TaxID=1564161 RepID=A0A521BPB1_9ACTN|nr:ATP-binding protein [Geodermatophilus aquaeductus]SMO48905.1 Histidine kinase-like ATPase domain-containing protein [Geodermatophilus aquaeductus]